MFVFAYVFFKLVLVCCFPCFVFILLVHITNYDEGFLYVSFCNLKILSFFTIFLIFVFIQVCIFICDSHLCFSLLHWFFQLQEGATRYKKYTSIIYWELIIHVYVMYYCVKGIRMYYHIVLSHECDFGFYVMLQFLIAMFYCVFLKLEFLCPCMVI